jgi:phosphoglycolate phosphatase
MADTTGREGCRLAGTENPKAGESWPRAVIFDLDGTLVDSAPDIASALNEVLGRRDLPAFPLEKVKAMIGGGIPTLIRRALTAHGVEPQDIEPLVTDMLDVYAGRATALTVLYDGAKDVLDGLKAAGVKMAVCTNKNQAITEIILRDLGVASYFGSVVGARQGQPKKPDAGPINLVLHELGVTADQAVMVGDSGADAGAAKAAGVPVVLASFGYCHDPLESLGPDAIIDGFDALLATLQVLAPKPAG